MLNVHWLPESCRNFLQLEALIRAHWLPNQARDYLWSGVLIRAHCLPDSHTNFLQLEALIRAHWLPNQARDYLWSGVLIRAHCLPDSHTNFLQLEALIRAYWFPNQPRNYLWSRALLRAHYLPDSHTNFLQLGALIRAYWFPNQSRNYLWSSKKLRKIRSSYQSSLSPQLTNKLLVIKNSPINQQRTCDLELLSELIDSLMTHKLSGFLGVSKSTSLLLMASHWPHNLWLQSTYLAMISGYQAAIIWSKTFWIEGVLRGWHSDYIHMKHSMWKVYLGWVSQSIF